MYETFVEFILPLLGWYPLFGIVWFYLLMNELVEKGKWAVTVEQSGFGKALLSCSIIFLFSLIAWPYSVYCHFRAGTIKDLFI